MPNHGAGGRPPLPTQRKKEQGTYRAHREKGKGPEPPALEEPPPPPARLQGFAREVWIVYAAILVQRKYLTDGDLLLLEMVSRDWARYLRLDDETEEEGATLKTERGVMRNPKDLALNAAGKNVLAGVRELGLTPSSRVRVRAIVPVPVPENPFDRFRAIPGGKR